ncbi:DNA-binding response regulator [Mariniphaga sediminis]|uniref:DNA-binding response regulator n=1 Tax=Mariniphaga sediminis TaxID=1628158 RepID=A0A399D1L7_9BACT|nr:LytTR family DNA-binding domain-containing protein [Mariniphaga sediminis]RIH65774.1 DNA-binding response regulator [Mariniphaga sediminis]
MNQTVKIILVEDELYNLRLLEGMIKKLRPEWEIVQTFDSVKESVDWLRNNVHPDLFFMDVQLADGLCFSIFDQVEIKSMVIFTTAYDNYAIRAFKVNSIDYLLKPFKEKDLVAAIQKFENLVALSTGRVQKQDYSEILEAIRGGEKKYRKRFLISKGEAFYKLPVEDIAYFYSENRVTTAVTFNRQNHVIDFSLEALEEQLEPAEFFRANRQIIVNIHATEKIENYFGGKLKVKLNPPIEEPVIVSRLKATDFKQWMGR